jgi:hypothetical protein
MAQYTQLIGPENSAGLICCIRIGIFSKKNVITR